VHNVSSEKSTDAAIILPGTVKKSWVHISFSLLSFDEQIPEFLSGRYADDTKHLFIGVGSIPADRFANRSPMEVRHSSPCLGRTTS
jgi:hypothetical protein